MEHTAREALQLGLTLQYQGRHEQAEQVFRQIATAHPTLAAGHFLLGRICFERAQYDEALPHLAEAVRLDPSQAVHLAALAEANQALHRWAEAEHWYRRAIQMQPQFAEAHVNLGNTLLATGRTDEAVACYQQALQCNPQLADAQSCLGVVHESRGALDRAADCYRQALTLRPGYAQAHCNLGTVLRKQHRLDEAAIQLRAAVKAAPNLAAAHSNLAAVYQSMGDLVAAAKSFRRVVDIEPRAPKSHTNLANLLLDQGDFAAATASIQEALLLDPDCPEAQFTQGILYLTQGKFAPGWAGYEHRLRCRQTASRFASQPAWDGSDVGDKIVLIHSEQGLGDTLQFIRYLKLARQRTARLVVAIPPALIPLCEQSNIEGLISNAQPMPRFDLQAALLSLPAIFHTELDSIPCAIPYLTAEPTRIESWRQRLAPYRGLRMGIAWRGSPAYHNNALRSIPLRCFEPLARVSGVRLFSLQKAERGESLGETSQSFQVVTLPGLDETGGAFMDTAAVMKNLDLVVTCDTAIPHLAGALGVPTWVALCHASEWRWMLERADSPWYPGMRLFRQVTPGDWDEVFERIAQEAVKLAAARPN
jgi:tetratricopeptide (TPR) repeat protein